MPVPIYEYHAEQCDGIRHFYSTNDKGLQGWKIAGIAFYAFVSSTHTDSWSNANEAFENETVPIYQFHYNQKQPYGGVRYLFSAEKNETKDGWILDKIAFHVFPYAGDYHGNQLIQIRRYHRVQNDGWRFCFDANEQKQGWIKDNAHFYALKHP